MVQGSVVAITGASSGIGKAIALHLVKSGAKVVLASRTEDSLRALWEEITSAGGEAAFAVTDVSKREDLMRLVEVALQRFGRLDVLFSNAGVMPIGRLDDLAVQDWEAMVDVNIKGVLFGIAAALPVFRKQGKGHFIHTASTAARKTVPNQVVYSATKAAVLAISDGLRQELAGVIRVSTILPGFTETAFANHIKDPELQKQLRASADKYAMSPDAVASAVAYLIDQPEEINVAEITLRSRAQP